MVVFLLPGDLIIYRDMLQIVVGRSGSRLAPARDEHAQIVMASNSDRCVRLSRRVAVSSTAMRDEEIIRC